MVEKGIKGGICRAIHRYAKKIFPIFNHSTQHCLMYMLENWKIMLDKGDMHVLCSWTYQRLLTQYIMI